MDNVLFLRLDDLVNIELEKAPWVLTNKAGKITQASSEKESISNLVQRYKNKAELAFIIPDRFVSYHIVEIPIKSAKKRALAIPYILEDKLLNDVDEMHFTVGPCISSNNYMVAVINRQLLVSILEWLLTDHGIEPKYILTDGICLYDLTVDDSYYNLYLNQTNQLAILIDNRIIATELDNIDALLASENSKMNCDIYSHEIENVGDHLKNSLKNLSISSQQKIDAWLPFLVTTWFKANIKNKFNIAHGLIKKKRFDVALPREWNYSATCAAALVIIFCVYKYLDTSMFTDINLRQNALIKKELLDLGIKTSDLNLAKKSISKQINILQDDISVEHVKDNFFILLSSFGESYKDKIDLNKILYQDNILELSMSVDKEDLYLLEEIKNKLHKSNISVDEVIINDDIDVIIEWSLQLKESGGSNSNTFQG